MPRFGRRTFLKMTAGAVPWLSAGRSVAAAGVPPGRAPYRMLFSNDTTNILSNNSPYHTRGEPFTEDKLRASVDETFGHTDAHMLQPGGGRAPWWKSRVAPADEYYRWLRDAARIRLDFMGEYMLAGGDLLAVFVRHCRERRIAPFVSMRLNDYHGTEHADLILDRLRGGEGAGNTNPGVQGCWLGRFYLEHPEYRIDRDPETYTRNPDKLVFLKDHGIRYKMREARVLDWAVPEVRAHTLALIGEVCEGYDIDGFELDFMRHARFFRTDETTLGERVRIMTRFVADVRATLDRTAAAGRRRWLCVRVPFRLRTHGDLGVDLAKWTAAGVDMINLSCHFVTEQQSDLAEACRLAPGAAVYLETTFVNHRYSGSDGPKTSGTDVYRKMTPAQFYTAAHLARARGAAGLSAFNFIYYRSLASPASRGEPPFHVLGRTRDRDWVARLPQHYFATRSGPHAWPALMNGRGHELATDRPVTITLDMAPPAGGWRAGGRLRVQGAAAFGGRSVAVRFNGVDLQPNPDVSEPYPNPWPDGLGRPDELLAWTVPAGRPKDGFNTIEIRLLRGEPLSLSFVDLAVA